MLKLSQGFAAIGASTIEDRRNAFHSILMATECLEYILPEGHIPAYQSLIDIQLNATDIDDYLNIANELSGQPFFITPSAQLASRCSAALGAELPPSPPPIRRALAMTPCTFS